MYNSHKVISYWLILCNCEQIQEYSKSHIFECHARGTHISSAYFVVFRPFHSLVRGLKIKD